MKYTFCIFFIMLICYFEAYPQINIYNGVTREKIKAKDGAVLSITTTNLRISDFYSRYDTHVNTTWQRGTKTVTTSSKSMPYDGEDILIDGWGVVEYSITITSPNFETSTVSEQVSSYVAGYFEINYRGAPIYPDEYSAIESKSLNKLEKDIYLVPKKEIIEGNLNINTGLEQPKQQSDDLGLLTTQRIASGLGISEEEVIKLITTNQLKGKKVGEKYFVRKEDFDAFMKK